MKVIDIKEVEREIKEILATDTRGMKKAQRSKLEKRITFLETCKAYLKTDPRPEFLEKERERLGKRIHLIKQGFGSWLQTNGGQHKNPNGVFEKENEIPKMRIQIKTLNFLLTA